MELKQRKKIINLINELEFEQKKFIPLVPLGNNNQGNGFTQQEWREYANRNEEIKKLYEELRNIHKL